MTEWLNENARRAYPLASTAKPKNRFDLGAWAANPNSAKCKQAYGTLSLDLATGTITLENNGTSGEAYTGASSSSAVGYYTLQQRGGVTYTLSASLGGTTTSSDIYLFFFDADGVALGHTRLVRARAGDVISVQYVPPAGSETAQIRFDTNEPGQISVYSSVEVAENDISNLIDATLLDACVGCDWLPDEGDLRLLDVRKDDNGLVLRIGSRDGSDRQGKALVASGTRGRVTVSVASDHVKALVTVSGPAADALRDSLTDSDWHDVDVPFAVRCCSYANVCVTAVEAYTPDVEDQCKHLVFADKDRTPVAVMTDNVVLRASDGVDLEAVASPDGSGTVLRVSAIAGEVDEGASEKTVDLVVRGDPCIAIESRPGVKMDKYGNETPDPLYGVVIVGSKCKPCCQCDDYVNAVKALRPYDNATTEIKRMLDEAKEAYETAAAAFDAYKAAAITAVNSYANLNATAVAVCGSPELYKAAIDASGTRSRITITMTVANLTQDTATLSSLEATCPGYALDVVRWSTAGSRTRTGTSVNRLTWRLRPGDTLTASWTFAKASKTNRAVKPSGMSVTAQAKLDHQTDPYTLSPEVK